MRRSQPNVTADAQRVGWRPLNDAYSCAELVGLNAAFVLSHDNGRGTMAPANQGSCVGSPIRLDALMGRGYCRCAQPGRYSESARLYLDHRAIGGLPGCELCNVGGLPVRERRHGFEAKRPADAERIGSYCDGRNLSRLNRQRLSGRPRQSLCPTGDGAAHQANRDDVRVKASHLLRKIFYKTNRTTKTRRREDVTKFPYSLRAASESSAGTHRLRAKARRKEQRRASALKIRKRRFRGAASCSPNLLLVFEPPIVD